MSEYIHMSHFASNLVYHFVNSVGKNTTENVIARYVANQGKQGGSAEYKQLYIHLGDH